MGEGAAEDAVPAAAGGAVSFSARQVADDGVAAWMGAETLVADRLVLAVAVAVVAAGVVTAPGVGVGAIASLSALAKPMPATADVASFEKISASGDASG